MVGMGAFFGSSRDLAAFERTIYDGRQHFIPIPTHRWQGIENQPQLLRDYGFEPQGEGEAPEGAYIENFEIDALYARIPPNEADKLNPQQLLLLKVADNALRDAGLAEGGNVAVIIAMGTELSLHRPLARYHLSWQIKESLARANIALPPVEVAELESIVKESVHPPIQTNEYVSMIGNIMASRISTLWNFSGPSFTLSAEENSTFKALEVAQMLLATGEVDAVLVGAVDLAGGVENVLLRNQIAPLNTGAKTMSYDQNSNGSLVGEGAGAVVLKPYDRAKSEQARIYAVIDTISIIHQQPQAA
ncbi:MAG TPA: beta-ketoacyl synthase N-terminal-like domain-containing protein, partial [Anaerolineae bacterium]|nr:beta-ketoacyl synthase N-terminal-like domain-containing protein [Anaerolineae bacterium]